MLLVAPVELPCLPDEAGRCATGRVAVTTSSVASGPTPAAPSRAFSCCATGASPRPGPGRPRAATGGSRATCESGRSPGTCTCSAGRSPSSPRPGGRRERTLLKRPVWDFDNQSATALAGRCACAGGDTLRVTCKHDAELRGHDPELSNEQPRYVTWGEGTSDEMCLGVVIYTES